jgi:hypothetical protein
MAVDLEQVECFPTYTKEFRVLIQDDGVANAISKLDFHNAGCKNFVALAPVTGSKVLKVHILQQATM